MHGQLGPTWGIGICRLITVRIDPEAPVRTTAYKRMCESAAMADCKVLHHCVLACLSGGFRHSLTRRGKPALALGSAWPARSAARWLVKRGATMAPTSTILARSSLQKSSTIPGRPARIGLHVTALRYSPEHAIWLATKIPFILYRWRRTCGISR
jgi:hypothetical protein